MKKSDAELLKLIEENFDTDKIETTGQLWWIKRGMGRRFGKQAGCIDMGTGGNSIGGYRIVRLQTTRYLEHRLVFLWIHKRSPKGEIDHLDHNMINNHPSNLRDTTHKENSRNRKMSKLNISGCTGVTPTNYNGYSYWRVSIKLINGKPFTKSFPYTDEGRQKAIRLAKKIYRDNSYHENHGKVTV